MPGGLRTTTHRMPSREQTPAGLRLDRGFFSPRSGTHVRPGTLFDNADDFGTSGSPGVSSELTPGGAAASPCARLRGMTAPPGRARGALRERDPRPDPARDSCAGQIAVAATRRRPTSNEALALESRHRLCTPVRRANASHRTACVVRVCTSMRQRSSSVDRARDWVSRCRGFDSLLTHHGLTRRCWQGRKPCGSTPPSGCASASPPGGAPVQTPRRRRGFGRDVHRNGRTARDAAPSAGLAGRRQAPRADGHGRGRTRCAPTDRARDGCPGAPRRHAAGARPPAWGASHFFDFALQHDHRRTRC